MRAAGSGMNLGDPAMVPGPLLDRRVQEGPRSGRLVCWPLPSTLILRSKGLRSKGQGGAGRGREAH
jgi:hypothetical protein